MKELIARIVGNPRTTVLGGVILAVYGAGDSLSSFTPPIEPWGTIVKGIAGVLVLVGLGLALDKPKPSQLPPNEPPKDPQ